MNTFAQEASRPLPNPFRTQQRIMGWVVVGLWALFFFFGLLYWHVTQSPDLTDAQWQAYLVAVILSGIFAMAFPLGYFVLIGEARQVELARGNFLEGRYLVHWNYRPADWALYTDWCRKNAKGRAKRLAADRPLECYVSTVAAFANGEWILWGTSNRRLAGVQAVGGVEGMPLMLKFSIEINDNTFYKYVLVPVDCAELAGTVVASILRAGHPGGAAWVEALRTVGVLSQILR